MLTGFECPAREGAEAGVLFPEYDGLFECFVRLPVVPGKVIKPVSRNSADTRSTQKAVNRWPGFGPATGRWARIVH